MYQDSDSGVWNVSLREERMLQERQRELAAEAFNRGDDFALFALCEDHAYLLVPFVRAALRAEANSPALRPALEDLRAAFVDRFADEYEDEAWDELAEAHGA